MRQRILLADPDVSLLIRYEEFLAWHGYEVATARNGLECIACLREATPDLLVLEPRLPWGQGEGVLAIMHEQGDLPNVPVMILTAAGELSRLDWLATFPITGYRYKPLSPAELVRTIGELLGKPGTRSSSSGMAVPGWLRSGTDLWSGKVS